MSFIAFREVFWEGVIVHIAPITIFRDKIEPFIKDSGNRRWALSCVWREALKRPEAEEMEFPRIRSENAIVFVRHCEPLFPDERKYFLGRTDWPLSPEGRRQAEALAPWTESVSWSGCCFSPLKRAKETVKIICRNAVCNPTEAGELKEIDLGTWDGCAKSDVMSEYPDLYTQREKDFMMFRHPGGERFADLEARAVPFLLSLCRKGGLWLVVSHAGVYRVFLHAVFCVNFPQVFRLDPGYGQIRVIERSGATLKIRGAEKQEAKL